MAMELTATPRAKKFEEFLEFVRRGEAEIIRDWSSPAWRCSLRNTSKEYQLELLKV